MIGNKKGFAPALILPVAGVVLAAILLALFVFSESFKWLIIGIGVLVGAFILLYGAFNSSGDLTKGKITIILVLVGLSLGFIFYSNVAQEAFGSTPEVYYPQYGNMKCALASADYPLMEMTGLTNAVTIKCGQGMNAYTDFCRFQIRMKGTNWLSAFPNVKFEKCNNAGQCAPITGITPINDYFTVYEINLDANRDGYLDSTDGDIYSTVKITPGSGWFTSTTYDVRVKGNAWYLEDTQGNNYRTTYEQGCDLNDMPQSYHETATPSKLNYQNSASQVSFGRSINYVWGITKGITSNVIYHNGKWVYIQVAGSYSPILTTPDGYKYVNWQQVIPDDSIKCVPSNVYVCNADATLRTTPSQNVSGQDCSLIRGVDPHDYLKASNGECCKFSCVNNKIVTSSCTECAVCKSGEIYNAQTNKCVNPTDTDNTNEELVCDKWYQEPGTKTNYKYNIVGIKFGATTEPTCVNASWLPLLVGGVIVLILGTILIIMWRPKPTKSKRSK